MHITFFNVPTLLYIFIDLVFIQNWKFNWRISLKKNQDFSHQHIGSGFDHSI